jgi:hypothetical protein
MLDTFAGKVNNKFDVVVEQGLKVTNLKRFTVKGIPDVKYDYYKQVKRILSDTLHKKRVILKVFGEVLHEVWEADIYELPKGQDIHDVCKKGIDGLKLLNTEIIEKVKKYTNV